MKAEIIIRPIDQVWQDPQSFCMTEFIRDELFYYFKCWDYQSMLDGKVQDAGFLGCFTIENMLAIRHTRFTKQTTYPVETEHDCKCYYYEITHSPWLRDTLANRTQHDPDWADANQQHNYRHFVLENAKYWVEVIGSNLVFEKRKKDRQRMQLWKHF